MGDKICFAVGDATAKGGIEKVTLTLASKLKLLKSFDVSILSLYKSHHSYICDITDVPVDYLSEKSETSMYNRNFNIIKGTFFDLFYILNKSIRFRKYLKNNKPDVVVCCDVKMVLLAYIASIFMGIKIIAVEHFEYDVPNVILKKVRKLIYKKIKNVVILTDEDKDKYSWLNPGQLKVIPNIVSVRRENVVEKKNTIVAVGRLCYQKGFDLLIDAWSQICEKNNTWRLEIYGDGEDRDRLLEQVDKYQIKNIAIKPFSSNIDIVYQQSKIFVLSSRFEGLGMVLIEALAHSLACISFDCPAGPKTIIKDGKNGILVPTGDVGKLASAMDLMISDQDLRVKYAENAFGSISQFSDRVVTDKWSKIVKGDI
ncbi:glycosyltransferase family 4 protein [Photobacterium atrarenae]|uniref:Glycosyltransferase family 4 protein n=1 Tax=Photobacterium atrarenae TaxID=865757 RepID=A0ABY5GDF9_9GAMM|nr:glycosyltransferase family 4 protein [Photobacterium atrarenae]UTV26973.1 glycosyltransferase family 4 protein [Photobacterium atrarenae]